MMLLLMVLVVIVLLPPNGNTLNTLHMLLVSPADDVSSNSSLTKLPQIV